MAKVVCVLYDDPVRWLSEILSSGRSPRNRSLSGRCDELFQRQNRSISSPARLPRQRIRRAGLAKIPPNPHGHKLVVTSDKDGAGAGPRSRAPRCRDRCFRSRSRPAYTDLRSGSPKAREAEARRSPRASAPITPGLQAAIDPQRLCGRRRCTLLQFDQRCSGSTTCGGDGNARPRAQLHPVVSVGGARRLEHRRLRHARSLRQSKACMSCQPSRPAASGSRYWQV